GRRRERERVRARDVEEALGARGRGDLAPLLEPHEGLPAAVRDPGDLLRDGEVDDLVRRDPARLAGQARLAARRRQLGRKGVAERADREDARARAEAEERQALDRLELDARDLLVVRDVEDAAQVLADRADPLRAGSDLAAVRAEAAGGDAVR